MGEKGGRGGVYQRILRAPAVFVVGAICGAVEAIELDYLPFHEIDCKLRKDFLDLFCRQVSAIDCLGYWASGDREYGL